MRHFQSFSPVYTGYPMDVFHPFAVLFDFQGCSRITILGVEFDVNCFTRSTPLIPWFSGYLSISIDQKCTYSYCILPRCAFEYTWGMEIRMYGSYGETGHGIRYISGFVQHLYGD